MTIGEADNFGYDTVVSIPGRQSIELLIDLGLDRVVLDPGHFHDLVLLNSPSTDYATALTLSKTPQRAVKVSKPRAEIVLIM